MNRRFLIWPLAAALAAGTACADDADRGTTLRLSTGIEHLSNGTPDWRDTAAGLTLKLGPRRVLDLSAGETRRFGLRDNQFAAAYSLPLTPALTATLDGNVSSTHHVLARHALGGELQYEFAPAWLVHAGARSSSYDSATVNQALFMLERYTGAFSWSAGWRPARAFGTTANGFELRGGYYYGERNAVSLILAAGKEAASVPGGVALTDVRAVALTGRHWLDRHWGVTYAAGHTSQGDLYSRNGINLGVQYAF